MPLSACLLALGLGDFDGKLRDYGVSSPAELPSLDEND